MPRLNFIDIQNSFARASTLIPNGRFSARLFSKGSAVGGVMAPTSQRVVRPFLTRFGVPSSSEPELPGYYCEERSLWVIETPGGLVPLATQTSSQLETRTKVVAEQTDFTTDFHYRGGTHTAVRAEQDDYSRELSLLIMATITESLTRKFMRDCRAFAT